MANDGTILTVADLRIELAELPGDTPVVLHSRNMYTGEMDEIQLDFMVQDGTVVFY